jgi:hypothetical protein
MVTHVVPQVYEVAYEPVDVLVGYHVGVVAHEFGWNIGVEYVIEQSEVPPEFGATIRREYHG